MISVIIYKFMNQKIYKSGRLRCAAFLCLSLICGLTCVLSAQELPTVIPTVMVEKAKLEPNGVNKKYIGRMEAIETISVQPRVSGNLMASHFREGGRIQKGQLLFEIEDTQYKAAVQNAKAQIDKLDAQVSYAKSSYERYEKLVKNNSVSQDTVDNAKSQYDTLKAEKDAAEAQLVIAQDNLHYTKIKSPISGRAGRVNFSNGNYITPQSGSLLTITYMDEVYVRFPMSEKDFFSLFASPRDMKESAVITLTLADGKPYEEKGVVEMMDNQIKSTTDSFNVWAKFTNPKDMLIPGGIVAVYMSTKEVREMPSVSVSAIMHRDLKSYIYVLNGDNVVEERRVMLDKMVGTRQFISSGVKENEVVVVDGMHKTRPGGTVAPIDSKQ